MLFGNKSSGGVEWLLVCLGNYGQRYENTRHNIGFLAADRLIEKNDLKCNRLRFRALTEIIELGGARVLLMKPQTYMNLSGEAVGEAARFYKVPPERVLVISDDVSLPLGKVRARKRQRGRPQRAEKHHRPSRHRAVSACEGRRRRPAEPGVRHGGLGDRGFFCLRAQDDQRGAGPRARRRGMRDRKRRDGGTEPLQRLTRRYPLKPPGNGWKQCLK